MGRNVVKRLQNGERFKTILRFTQSQSPRRPSLLPSDPEDANPSVDDGLCSDTVTARAKSGAPYVITKTK